MSIYEQDSIPNSPTELLKELFHICPSFKKYWNKVESLLRRADDSYTPCSILSELVRYLEKKWSKLKHTQKLDLFELVESLLTKGNSVDMTQAIKTCFLDNCLHSSNFSEIKELSGLESERYLEAWDKESFSRGSDENYFLF